MTNKQYDVRALAKTALSGVKNVAEVQTAVESVAAQVGKRVPTIAEVFAGTFVALKVIGLDQKESLIVAKLIGQSTRVIMDDADKEAAEASAFTETGPADSAWVY